MVDETIAVPHYVYKLSCSVPGVGDYVGRTKRIGKREFEHKKTYTGGARLRAAIELHGAENFIFSVLCVCATREDAERAEAQHIERLGTLWPRGLNIQVGSARPTPPPLDLLGAVQQQIELRARQYQARTFEPRRKRVVGFSVYTITHIETGMVYVGRTKFGRRRFSQHLRSSRSSRIGGAMRREGVGAFRFEIVATFEKKEDAAAREIELIRSLGTLWPAGFNLKGGGIGTEAPNMSSADRAKRRAALKGRTLPPETRAKIKDAWQRNYGERVAAITAANHRVQADRVARGIPHPSKGTVSPFKGATRGPYGQSRIKPGTNARRTASLAEAYTDPELRARVSQNSKRMWSDPEFRAKRLAQMGDPGHRAKIREARARQKFSPESIKRRSDSVRATWAAKRAAKEGQK